MKNLLKSLSIIILVLVFIACADQLPGMRVMNERTTKANVQIKTVNNTINHNDVLPGTSTNYQEVSEGAIEVTAEIQNETVSPTKNFTSMNNNNYTIVIVNSTPPAIRIDVSDK
jgi:hypothetical protein